MAEPLEVEEIIRSTGFYKNKTKSLIGMAPGVVERFGGEVPSRMDDLVTLPGVGRKTANVLRSVAMDLPGPPGRHPRRAAVPPARPHPGDRPGEGGAGAQRHGPGQGAGRVQPAPDPARPGRVRGPQAPLRRLRAGRLLPERRAPADRASGSSGSTLFWHAR